MKHLKILNYAFSVVALAGLSSVSSSALADQVIVDDLIVDGSVCAGQDCVNGESFGFDTLRLKENNLRLHFEDTSASASFPSNDWRIIANDSSNGGGNYLAIEDSTAGRQLFRVDAGAPANSLRVDSQGDVGIGTATPAVGIHHVDGNTPTLRLEQDGSSGFTPQTWDMAGNESNFFIRDTTNGSKLPFRIKPGAPTDALTIAADGDIGMGTLSPDDELDIEGTGPAVRLTQGSGPLGPIAWRMFVKDDSNRFNIGIADGNTPVKIGNEANNNLLKVGTNASDQVDITGNLVISGSCSAGGGACADHVFEADYKKLSLAELKDFISTKKHLPKVPSANDMKKNGIGVAQMSGRLLEKIEELVLYTLEQQETIDRLQTRMATLETSDSLMKPLVLRFDKIIEE
ncbi:hypothetical protein [uncultured Cocleimonas sp.]|uniref:hypothetical protein n=1 Tax=uncultured Cocleimonas sp. TaxID=1051587 RepID=UPI00262515D4|nr:hypothetical protein [uncultured Cocleimonas sp.]